MRTFINANIIDGLGNNFHGYFSIKNGKFIDIGKGEYKGNDSNLLDMEGKYISPGFIDCHVHFYSDGDPHSGLSRHNEDHTVTTIKAVKNAEKTLRAGVTTVRDCGSKNGIDLGLKTAANQGLCLAPRMYVCGCMICMTGGHGWRSGIEADGVDEIRKTVRELLKKGVDHIKLVASGGILSPGTEIGASQYTEEEIRAAVEVAKFAGKTVCAHAHGTEAIKNAVRGGVTSIEHGYLIDDEGVELMLENKTYLVATSAAVRNVVKNSHEAGISEDMVSKASQAIDKHISGFKKAHKAGVKMAMGTDSGVPFSPHGNNLDELGYLVEMGLSPMEAIQVSTLGGAQLLNIDNEIGSIEVNKYADFIVIEKNPLEDINILLNKENINCVYLNGNIIK